jgi:hypothetical protein
MTEYEVTCVRKPNRNSTHEHITHIGNRSSEWMMSREVAIERIENKKEAFYTVDRATGKRAYIGVVRAPGRAPFLRTHSDGKWNDNLLALAECDGACKLL